MKRCHEWRKDYLDDSLLYCLEDGTSLVQGTIADEPAAAILSGDLVFGERESLVAADGKLKLIVSKDLSADLDYWQFDTFQSIWSKAWWDKGLVTFQLSPFSADVESMSVDGAILKREAKPNQ